MDSRAANRRIGCETCSAVETLYADGTARITHNALCEVVRTMRAQLNGANARLSRIEECLIVTGILPEDRP